ncbi:MAG: glycosyltransferase family 4 protein [Leptolyngbyaceae cyanobacterium SL_7_1]|nr:glycosyltransferase family 4 protein [Leptolyngbyaceae cyanobacterium SL_7_1]
MSIRSQPALTRLSSVSLVAPDLSGGGVTRVYLLAQVLQQLNLDVKVVGFQFGQSVYPVPPATLPVEPILGSWYPQLFNSIPTLLRAIDGQLVYAVKPKPTSFGIALLKKLIHRCPVLLDIDDWELSWLGGDQHRYRPHLKQLARDALKSNGALRNPEHKLYLEWMERLTRYANGITVDTQFLQQRFGGTYLPNGKDTDLFDPSRYVADRSRSLYGLDNYRVLMFPGTARPHKGLEDVLIALDQLNQTDLRLVIVGGRKPDDYEDRLINQWGRWIIKLPAQPVEKMPEVVAAAHVIVVPQRQTPTAQAQLPLKLTDGMAMAKPILSTTVGDIPILLNGVGYLVDPNSPEQIARQIQWIFSHWQEAEEHGRLARIRCIDRYSVKTMASLLLPVIEQCQLSVS